MSTDKWSIRFYRTGVVLPVESFDGSNSWDKAARRAVTLARQPERKGLECHVVNTRPTAKERGDFLRWRLNLTTNPPEFDGIVYVSPAPC